MILRALKAVLLNREPSNVYLYAVNLKNETIMLPFDSNGEVLFGSFVPVGIWLRFSGFANEEVPDIEVVFSGDQISL
jgi:hypothetical protein